MALATVTFWGEGYNTYGLPNKVYTYLVSVYVNHVVGMKDKIVKIIPLTESTPKPARDLPFIVKNSDAKTAFLEAFGVLEEMESLKGLKSHKSVVELDKQNSLAGALKSY